MGIGFAIPVNMIKNIRDQLVENGSVIRGYLGVYIQDLSPDLAKSFGLKNQKGVLIAQVTEGSPAEEAGLKQSDIIVGLNGSEVARVGPFRNRVALHAPGSEQTITVIREGERKEIPVTIGTLPTDAKRAALGKGSFEKLGLNVENLTEEMAEQFSFSETSGVVVTAVEPVSEAASAGIRAGMVITEVNRRKIHNIDEFRKAIEESQKSETVLLLVKDRKRQRYAALKLKGK